MSKPWGGGIGTWAEDVEREEREMAATMSADKPQTLKESVSAKPKKNKKMSLTEFFSDVSSTATSGAASRGSQYKGLTPDEMIRLPTGPKEEMQQGRLGRGVSSYGRSSGESPGSEGDGSWGGGRKSYGGFADERREPSRVSNFDRPSRVDEVDNWATTKKSMPSTDSGRQDRYAFQGGGGGGFRGGPRADEVDSWGFGKKQLPARSSNFSAGFRDSVPPESDRWARGAAFPESERDRPRLTLDPPKSGGDKSLSIEPVKTSKPNPFGAARPREDVLAEKGLDWRKLDLEIEAKKSSRPSSSHSSRPSSVQSSRSEGLGVMHQQGMENVVIKSRPKVNPFGEAKPREVTLEEQGKNWRKIDLELEHRSR